MSLPKKIDEIIRKELDGLVTGIEDLKKDIEYAKTLSSFVDPEIPINGFVFEALRIRFINLLELLGNNGRKTNTHTEDVRKLEAKIKGGQALGGMITGLKNSYEGGLLESLTKMIEAEVASDYLGQAEQLLSEGQPGKFDHVPAAVLLGAILEDALRRLCGRQNPPINVVKQNGEKKTLYPLIDDLKKAEVFTESKAKQLRSWADTRNHAAHGEFSEFTRHDVEQMKIGVENFLADYL